MLPSPYLFQKHHIRRWRRIVVVFLFSNTKQKATTNCCCLLHLNTTTEKNDSTLPSSSSSLEHHYKRRWQHIAIVFFFSNTKKIKHIRKQQKTKPKKGRELTFKLLLYLFTFGSRFYPSISNAFSWHLFLFKQKKIKENKEKNHREEKKCKEGRELSFKLPLCPVTFNSRFCLHFYPFVSNAFSWYFLFIK